MKNPFNKLHTLLVNFSSLFILQFSNYLIPLITIPYIVRMSGAETFGRISYAAGVISYFTIIVNYGFDYSATKQVAINRNSKNLNEIFCSVIEIKLFLFLLTSTILIFLFPFSKKISSDSSLYLATLLVNLGYALFPNWFFQGMEKMTGMAVFSFIIKLLGAIAIFSFFKGPADSIIVPLSVTVPHIFVGVISVIYIMKKNLFSWQFGNYKMIKFLLIDGAPIFISTLLVSFYTMMNFIILGWFVNDFQLGLFGGVYKLISAILIMIISPFNTAIFPFISRTTNASMDNGLKLFQRLVILSVIINGLASVVIFIFSEKIVLLILGQDYVEAIPLMKIASLLPFLVGVATTLTVQGLYNFGLHRYNPLVGLILSAVCISLNLIFIPQYGSKTGAWVWVLCEFLEVIIVSGILYANKIPLFMTSSHSAVKANQ